MAVSLGNKKTSASATGSKPAQSSASKPSAPSGAPSFLKRGKEAQETMAKVEHQIELNKTGKVFRFFVKEGEETQITFLDGDLLDGVLDIPFFYQHNVQMNGKWGNFFLCTQDTEPCPVCEGSNNPSYVAVMSVIDHTEYKSTKDGKVYKDERKLFVATRDTVKMLQKKAAKWGGLAGVKFDVSRTGDKSPAVGNSFDFVEKLDDKKLQALYGEKGVPFNYEEVLGGMYLSAKDLRKLGFGAMVTPVGGESAPDDGENYEGKM